MGPAMPSRPNDHGPLGRQVEHSATYDPDQLFPLPRRTARKELGIEGETPFYGVDIWNGYEISWLGAGGLPRVATAVIRIGSDSANIIESKSMKLYFNSFNQSRFESVNEVARTMEDDLRAAVEGEVNVALYLPPDFSTIQLSKPAGICLDDQSLEIEHYTPDAGLLFTAGSEVSETLYSNLLRSMCPVTGQPDWGTVVIDYSGPAMDRGGLLRYLVSYRQHTGFHENCVERIFLDIQNRCRPQELEVRAQFTRRGGIDINPVRTSFPKEIENFRFYRQ